MKHTNSFLYGIIFVFGMLIFLFVVGLMFIGEYTLPDERTYTDMTVEDYGEGWERIRWNGVAEPIELPGNYDVEGNHLFVIRKKLDVWTDRDSFLSFNSEMQDVKAYVDNELRYEFSTKDTRLFGSHSPHTILYVPLHPSDNGKTIKIVFDGDNNYSGIMSKFVLGTQYGILMATYNSERYTLLLTLFLLTLGIIAFIIGVSVKLSYNKTLPLFFSGWTVICAAMWQLSESASRQFFVPNFSLLSYLTYLSLIMLPFATCMYFDCLQDGKYRFAYMVLIVLEEFSALTAILLQFYNNTDLSELLPIAFLAIVLTMLLYLVTVIPDLVHGDVKKYYLEFLGILGAIIMGVVQIVDYQTNHPTSINGLYLIIGLLFMIIMSYFRALRDIRIMERDMFAAVQAHDASTAFMTRMSHEMRTPINAILGKLYNFKFVAELIPVTCILEK